MTQHGVHALAVVNAQDQLLGIITTTDIVHAALGRHVFGPAQGRSAVAQRIKLSAEQLDHAVAAAQAATDRDPDFVEQALLYMHAGVALLEQVRHIASRFMQAGQDEQLHSALRKALEAASHAEEQGYIEAVKRS